MRSIARWVLVALALAALLIARWRTGETLDPRVAIQWLADLKHEAWVIPAFIGVYGVGTTAFIPASVFAIVAGTALGFGPGLLLSQLALSLVANAHFGVGRWLGQARLRPWLERRGWHRVVRELDQHGIGSVIAVRQLPLPFVAVNVGAGASPVRWRDFAIGTALGGLAPSIVYTWSASALSSGAEGAWRTAGLRAALGGGAMLALSFGWRWWRGRQVARTSPT